MLNIIPTKVYNEIHINTFLLYQTDLQAALRQNIRPPFTTSSKNKTIYDTL